MILRKAVAGAALTCVCAAIISSHAAAATSAAPFGGSAVVLPGTIEAENFDDGGASVAYFDTTAGNRGGAYRQTDVDIEATSDIGGGWDVGWTRAGEWLQYTATVTTTGTYALELRVASASTGAIVRVDVDGADVTGPLTVPNTGGWQTWTTMRKDGIVVASGTHRIRLTFVAAGTDGIANVNFLRFVPSAIVPSPWSNRDIGQPGIAGTATFANNAFTVKGSGADIWGTSDAFQFVSQPASGDTQIVVRVTSMDNTSGSAKAAAMLRESVAADAATVILDVEPSGNIEFMTRRTKGDTMTYIAGAAASFPAWLKLSRIGTTLVGSVSSDGATWRQVGTTAASATLGLVGLAVNSHSTLLNTSVFDNVTVGAPPAVLPPAPTAPAALAPTSGAASVPLNVALSWSASGAAAYDVMFGTSNPPPAAATGLTTATYTPSSLTNDTTYYWQIAARNAGGTTTSPVWAFRTLVAPPATPIASAPANGGTGIAVNTQLAWAANGATGYDVRFGTTNPPAVAATGLAAASYSPAALANNTTYYWQVVAQNAGGSTAGPVWSFTTIVAAPSTPTAVLPGNAATGISLSATMSWSAAGATTYDVRFGTANPPPAVVAGLAGTPSYAPAGLTNETTYYWQVVAQNAGGTTVGPVWSFTTVVAAPAAPTALAPADNAIAVANPLLSWSASRATAYDVSLGTTNPPANAVTGAIASSYAPPALAAGTMYYWQVVARNDGGATAGPVWSFATAGVPAPWTTRDVGAVGLPGSANYANEMFTVAGAGADIWGTADAFQFVSQPVSGDTQIVARVVNLQATRAKAKAGIMLRESAAADAAHVILAVKPGGAGVEFMTRTTAGGLTTKLSNTLAAAPAYVRLTRIGTTVTGAVSADGVAWTTVGTTTASSAWPLAGLIVTSLDITVLNTATFDHVAITVPPQPQTKPPTPGISPTAYNAVTDRTTYFKPALPQIGPAGSSFYDATFGSKIVRVTDALTRPGFPNRSYRAPSNALLAAWNASSTAFYVISNDGTAIPFAFDGTTVSAARIQATTTDNGGTTLAFYQEPQFSLTNPNLIYGAVSGANNRTIGQYDFQTRTYTPIVDMDTIVSGLSGTFLATIMTAGTPEKLMAMFGGAAQDAHYLLMWSPIGNLAARKVLNTVTSTINGVPTNVTLNFHLHAAFIDKTGRYVMLGPRSTDLAAPRSASQIYVWDTVTDIITPMTAAMHSGGHATTGYGVYINQDCCTSTNWDAMEWQFRYLNDLTRTSDLVSPSLQPKEIYASDHQSWNNARSDALVPVISATYRYGDFANPWRAWDDEIIGIDTANGGGGLVYRFAHHRSDVRSDADPTRTYFWYQPIANVSPDGRFVIFTSNWEKTLGKDAAEGTFRQDVFLVQLTPR